LIFPHDHVAAFRRSNTLPGIVEFSYFSDPSRSFFISMFL